MPIHVCVLVMELQGVKNPYKMRNIPKKTWITHVTGKNIGPWIIKGGMKLATFPKSSASLTIKKDLQNDHIH